MSSRSGGGSHSRRQLMAERRKLFPVRTWLRHLRVQGPVEPDPLELVAQYGAETRPLLAEPLVCPYGRSVCRSRGYLRP